MILTPTNETGVAIERQKFILDHIHANPLGSFVFSGPPGVGKTTLLRELERCSRAARWKNHPVYFATMMEFQRVTTAKSNGAIAYGVTADGLRDMASRGCKYSLFFDDFDKVRGTEFIRLHLLEIVNAAVETDAQLGLTTNMTKAEFAKFFADTVYWRIARHCTWVEIARESSNPAQAAAA